mgnify:CR=1 FL=1
MTACSAKLQSLESVNEGAWGETSTDMSSAVRIPTLEVVDITGVVLTKLDGTAKGGIVFRVQEDLGVPVKLVGLGEGPDDLAPFEPGAFVDALLG